MGAYVTATGLVLPNLVDVLKTVSDEQKANVDPNLDTSPESVVGQLNAILLAARRDDQETIQIAYDSFNPDAAEGFGLEALSALTGTEKAAATYSRFFKSADGTGKKLKVSLNANKTVPIGTIFSQLDNSQVQFVTTEVVASTTAGDYYVTARCFITGPIACNAGTLTVIQTPVDGLTAVTNEYDAILGTNVDTDEQLRERREAELRAVGNGTVDSMQARLAEIELDDGSKPIQDISVVENPQDYPDTLGRPPHSVEALVFDGEGLDCPDDTIAQVIWDSHPAGTKIYGYTHSGTAVDSDGIERVVPFNRPLLRPVKIELDIDTNGDYAGDDAVKTAVLAIFVATRQKMGTTGRKVKCFDFAVIIDRSKLTGSLGQGVPGVTNINSIKIAYVGDSFPGSMVDLSIPPRDMTTLDTADISIV